MLEEHLCYMRLRTENDFQNQIGDQIIKCFRKLPSDEPLSNDTLVNKLKSLQKTQHLMFWLMCPHWLIAVIF